MRILALQNLYPPHGIGGCAVAAQEMINCLRSRGNETLVLTSAFGGCRPQKEDWIWRTLPTYKWSFIPQRFPFLVRELVSRHYLNLAMERLHPDVAVIWSLSGLSLSLLFGL